MRKKQNMPGETAIDKSLLLLASPYRFISDRSARYRSDIFQTRLLLQKTICMRGEEAARLFYDQNKFRRSGAAPMMVKHTLFGQGGIQATDGETHRARKQLFMSLMTPHQIDQLAEIMEKEWNKRLAEWGTKESVVLLDELQEILTVAVCTWAGVPLEEMEVKRRAQDLRALIEAAGSAGIRFVHGLRARSRSNKWIEKIIRNIRDEKLAVPHDRAAYLMAWHREPSGQLMRARTAAVDLINVLRPTTAVAYMIAIAVAELSRSPEWQERLRAGSDEDYTWFVQEVRRLYPLLPSALARVSTDFEWKGYHFAAGTRVILDLFGTNRDPRIWRNPDRFDPDRFRNWSGSAFDFIPQGGGDHHLNHRCPGEWITINLMKRAMRLLIERTAYDIPPQDLTIDLNRAPAAPGTGVIMTNVRPSSVRVHHRSA